MTKKEAEEKKDAVVGSAEDSEEAKEERALEEEPAAKESAEAAPEKAAEGEAETVEDVVAKYRGEAPPAEREAPKESAPPPHRGRGRKGARMMNFGEKDVEWIPKTKLGNEVLAGKYKTLDDILEKGLLILEPEIIDALIPDILQEIIYIGGSPGKGGGIRRTATKMTARMHKSGRRFKLSAVAVVGNGNGVVGIGSAISKEHRTALEKAVKHAKLNTIRVRRGCGSWECGCGGDHSIPFKTRGKSGSVQVTLIPAPKGVGMVASEETKKMLKLAGINDVWVKTSGKTSTRNNLVLAVFDAIKNLNKGKGEL
jgi:small subunit ribosomal protein S5